MLRQDMRSIVSFSILPHQNDGPPIKMRRPATVDDLEYVARSTIDRIGNLLGFRMPVEDQRDGRDRAFVRGEIHQEPRAIGIPFQARSSRHP